ncbi:MAG: SurA N-terminal domain-containing protein [Candidatus Cloacimonadaceae bacterium]
MKTKYRNQSGQHLRSAVKFFLGTGILLLLISGCAYQKSENAGRVNGVYIKTQDFMNSLRGHFTGFMLEKDRTPDDAEKRELYKTTWKNITIHTILKSYFAKYDIVVTEKEVIDSLLNNPPASIQKAPLFQTNGSFDKDKYVRTLLNDRNGQLDWLKQHYYNYYVPLGKLKIQLMENEVISKKELSGLHKVMNNSADLQWIMFDPADEVTSVSRAEIETYYFSHQNDYQITPGAVLGWVAIAVKLNQDDIDTVKTRIDSIYFELTNGKPFSIMVERLSQSPSSASGGSLGFLKLEELSSAIRSALEPLDRNGFTRPLKIDNYWVIYQLAERTTNLVKLNELVLEITPGEANKSQTKETAIHLRDLALQLDLDTAAGEMNFSYKRSVTVTKDSLWLADQNLSAYILDRAFTQKPGALLEPVYSEDMQAWIMTEVIEVQPFKYKPLITVNDEIYNLLLKQKQQSAALEHARNWALANKNKHLETAAKASKQIIKTSGLLITGSVLSEPVSDIFVSIVTDHQQKKIQQPYLLGDKVLLPVVTKITTLSPQQFSESAARQYYFDNINPDWFEEWLDAQVKKANVNIWFSYP